MRRFETNHVNRWQGIAWWLAGTLPVALWLTVLVSGVVQAGGFRSPEECQASTGKTHLQCLYEHIVVEQENTGTIEERIDAEREMIEQLREQRERVDGTSSGHELQGRRADQTERPSQAVTPPPRSASSAPNFRAPEECLAYTGDAHLNCLYAYIEMQQSKTGKVEEELRAQKGLLGQLRDQIDRQASVSDDLERRLAERQSTSRPANVYVTPPARAYPGYIDPGYAYSSPGLSLYFGLPGYYYGPPFYGPRLFGPGFYGQRFYGPRFNGPRFYGPRSFGPRRR
ncbi:MAG: hypothetical protein ACREJU_11905 [Nitrospiraceae bacterium]